MGFPLDASVIVPEIFPTATKAFVEKKRKKKTLKKTFR